MTPHEAQTLVDYHYWARDRMLEAVGQLRTEQFLRDLGSSFKSVRDTLAHLHGAESIWYARWRGESPTSFPPVDRFQDAASVTAAWAALEADVRALFGSLDQQGLDRVIEYKLISGAPGASVLSQMLQHVVNHASYHRGQVTTMLRQLGAAPPASMDLIAYHRERAAAGVQ
jgi:uncharacterized damage-inducible protein DinB